MVNKIKNLTSVDPIDISAENAQDDIRLYVKHTLTMASAGSGWAAKRKDWVPTLVERAENLFQWAATACAFIIQDSAGSLPETRYLKLTQGRHSTLNQLYETVIDEIVHNTTKGDSSISKEEITAKIRRVLSLILIAREPLSWQAWLALLDENGAREFLEVIPYLGSLLRGAFEHASEPIQPLHTSFREYATLPAGTHSYTVDTSTAERTLTTLSFRVMKGGLRFNICSLETSYIPNKDVQDLASRIANNVPAALMYACRFWDTHLKAAPSSLVSLEDVRLFLEKRLLFWLEVMALNKMVDSASRRIKELCKWIKGNDGLGTAEDPATKLDGALADVDQFISMCGAAISLSTPHLYLSALAYVPATSFIHQHYSKLYIGSVHVINKDNLHWPECIMRIATSSPINDVAISPDGRIIATAHDDRTIGLWNAVTGERVGEPLIGHTYWVRSVAFCPDGTTIASGSDDGTIHLWNVATGEQIGYALRGHAGGVMSVTFSPDGQTLVSGSRDKTVRLWHVSRREPAGEALVGHTDRVNSVAFSPGGRIFASGSDDRTVRVWSADTRELLYALEGHTDHVWSVAFSPDSRTLASGAGDNTIRLWDTATGQPKGDPLAGHTDPVWSVAFSPDGRTLASGSMDLTIRLWQVDTGQPVGDPLRGHTSRIRSIAFLSDSLTLISGAEDGTIRMWKIDPAQAGRVRSAGHSEHVRAVAFSPDNKTAVSGSSDRTVRLWDVRTGQPVGEPLRGHAGVVSVQTFDRVW
ncbi:WD40 repeat-like protein [Trametopsis cervina]|nr:WD40 repeat-like protein [Trametopsis cervina]